MTIWELFIVVSFLLGVGVRGQNDFKHELPPGVELVNPKDLGLTDADLGKFLGNVKVLGGGQVGDTKTQILTVGFDGDENLNVDDFDIPGLTDKKGTNLPDKDKEIANVAFEKFKEFFKNSKSAKSYEDVASKPSLSTLSIPFATATTPTISKPQTQSLNSIEFRNQKHQQPQVKYTHTPRPSAQTLQQHYPVTLTQPSFTTSRPPPPPAQHNNHNNIQQGQGPPIYQPEPQFNNLPQNYQTIINPNQNQNHPQAPTHNHHQENFHQQNANPNNNQQQQKPLRNHHLSHDYMSPLIAAQNQLQSHINQQLHNARGQPIPDEFGAKLPNSQPSYNPQQIFHKNAPTEYRTIQNYPPVPPPQFTQQQPFPQQPSRPRTQEYPQQPPSAQASFQNLNLVQQPKDHQLKPEHKESSGSFIGKIVRNQLNFGNPYDQPKETPRPQQVHNHILNNPIYPQQSHQSNQYQTILPHHFAQLQQESSTIPSTLPSQQSNQQSHSQSQHFPQHHLQQLTAQGQNPVSHVYIRHENQNMPIVQQTSFHPRFIPPSKFVNNFNPSAPLPTTPTPKLEVTPSMPMILLSTNENAITDPERMERLRQQQRHREQIRQREYLLKERQQEQKLQQQQSQRQSHAISFPQQQLAQQSAPIPQIPAVAPSGQLAAQYSTIYTNQQYPKTPRVIQNPDGSVTTKTFNSYQQQQQQNSINFIAQPQQHQLHLYQQQRQPSASLYLNPERQQSQQVYLAQPSSNYPQHAGSILIQPQQGQGPPRFQIRPDSQQQYANTYSTIRQKRGYRARLGQLLRDLGWKDRTDDY